MFLSRILASFRRAPGTVIALPEPEEVHYATVKDRVRNSGLTSVRFVDDDTCVAADFGNKRVYLVDIADPSKPILDSHDTVVASGDAVETDLIDYHDGRFIVSNFYQGSFSLFEIADRRIRFVREIGAENGLPNLHGLRFVPGQPDLIWLAGCNWKNPCHRLVDLDTGEVLWTVPTERQCQDVAFSNGHAIVFARTNHISKGAVELAPDSPKNTMFATAYVYRMPDDLRAGPPELVHTWQGDGHLDACKEAPDGRIFGANQYLDRVDVFRVGADGTLEMIGSEDGFDLPHGLDVRGDRMAVTNYGDQTLRVVPLPS